MIALHLLLCGERTAKLYRSLDNTIGGQSTINRTFMTPMTNYLMSCVLVSNGSAYECKDTLFSCKQAVLKTYNIHL